MRIVDARVFVSDVSRLGEGPVWFDGRLWWVDVEAGRLRSVDADGEDLRDHDLGRRLGASAPTSDGRFVVALEDGIGFFDPADGTVEIVVSPEGAELRNRFNDGKCDLRGRFVAGTLNRQGGADLAALYSFSPDGGIEKILDPVSLSNGLAWTHDGGTLFYIDTPTREVAAFDYDLETGQMTARRVVVEVPEAMGFPDGMEIDVEGNLWVAHWGGGAVRCWSPITGECLAEVPVRCACPTSCAFGGADLATLFITSASSEFSGEESDVGSPAGSVFACRPGVAGYPVRTFGAKVQFGDE